VAGEPSGDLLGARLMAALKAETGARVRFDGIGGPRMEREGLRSRVPLSDLAVMGILEVIPHAPRILRHLRETADAVRALRPDAVVTIDAPAFSTRLAHRLKGSGVPVVHYVAPTVWAWKAWRAKEMAGCVDHLITLLPFEAPYFERHGLSCTFVGYPAIEDAAGGDGPSFRAAHGIAPDAKVLCAMPGSRKKEIHRLLPTFERTVERLRASVPGLAVVLPAVENVADLVGERVARWKTPVLVSRDPAARRHLFAASDVALVKSGTASVELAAAGVPIVVTQRIGWFAALMLWAFAKVRYVSLVNLLEEREVQPELLQGRATPRRLAAAIESLLRTEERAWRIEAGLRAARALGLGGEAPSRRAARAVLSFVAGRTSARAASAPPP
jgi:lipid-A-disaccharide synthase